MPRPTLSLISLPDLSKIFTWGLSMPCGGKPNVLPEMATQTLSFLSTVSDVIVSRPEANTPTLYPGGTLILLGSGLTGVRVDHLPAGPPGSATARSCANADHATNPTANANTAACIGILISSPPRFAFSSPSRTTPIHRPRRRWRLPMAAHATTLFPRLNERSDVRDYALDLLIAQAFFPGGHGRDLSHVGAALLDDHYEIFVGDLVHIFFVGQRSDVRAEPASMTFASV